MVPFSMIFLGEFSIAIYNVDKGIFELLDAFAKLQNKYSRIALLLIGNFDGDLPIRLHGIRNNPDIIITGWINSSLKIQHIG